MNEQMIFQQTSQLAFQNLMQGKSEKEAVESAESSMDEIIKRTKRLAKEFEMSEPLVFQQVSQLVFQSLMQGKSNKESADFAEATVKDILERSKKLSAKISS